MSYDLYLVNQVTGEVLELGGPHHMRGGTYALGGTTLAHLNVTYNYARHFVRVFEELEHPHPRAPYWMLNNSHTSRGQIKGIQTIYGLTGAESLPVLAKAIAALGDDVDEDYWEPTEGNAKQALIQLHALATMRPDGVWEGD